MPMKKILLICLVIFTAVNLVPQKVFAIEPIKLDNEASLTIDFYLQGQPVEDMEFAVYYVAKISESGEFVLQDLFTQYPVKVNGLDSEGWKTAAETLMGYAYRDEIAPVFVGKTDENGSLPLAELPLGLYLVSAVCHETDTYRYETIPFLVSLPNHADDGDTWSYDVHVMPKYERSAVEAEFITRKVKKLWYDQGKETYRPERITVQLLCDGEVYDTVALSDGNDWQHVWTELEADHQWYVVEKAERGYIVTSFREMDTFIINNTAGTLPDDESVLDESQPNHESDQIPNTGQLWWPIPVLLVFGFLCLILGFLRRQRGEK